MARTSVACGRWDRETSKQQNRKPWKGSTGKKENLGKDPQAKIPLVLEAFLAAITPWFRPVRNGFVGHLGDPPALWSNLWSNSSVCDPPTFTLQGQTSFPVQSPCILSIPQPVLGRGCSSTAGGWSSWLLVQAAGDARDGGTWLQRDPLPFHQVKKGIFPAINSFCSFTEG